MKKVIFILSFIFSCILGMIVESLVPELHYHAVQVLDGKPLPFITEFNFRYFGYWRNGSILCVLILPWTLLLLCNLLTPRIDASRDQNVDFLLAFICFLISEGVLFLFFALSSFLPFIPVYGILPARVSISAYIPHMLISSLVVVIICYTLFSDSKKLIDGGS